MYALQSSTTTQQDSTISSEDLFTIVNEARDSAGEPTVQYSHFLARAEDELDENIHYKNFVVKNLPNGTKRRVCHITLKGCTLIGMRESKAVRRSVLARLETLESAAPQPQFNLPTTYLDALKCLVAETEAHNETKAVMQQATGYLETAVGILKRDAPKVKVHDTIMHSEGALLISDAARVLNVSQTKLFTFLERSRWIFRAGKHKKYKAYAPHIHNGNLVQLVKDAVNHDGDPVVTSQVQITAQGIAVLANLLVG